MDVNVRILLFLTFTGILGRTFYGRLQSSPSMTTICEVSARNGKHQTGTGRLENNYPIIHYQAEADGEFNL